MALKDLFRSARGTLLPKTDARNHEGAPAYALDSRTALAQLAATGCFGSTFYVSGVEQLELVLEHARKCDPQFVAKVAVYARERGFMKDMPAVLLAHLCTRGPEGLVFMKQAFPRVIDNARMLRNFVQVLRSGQLGRKSLGSAPKAQVQKWLAGRSALQLFQDSVGNDPSLADVVKMVHPMPCSDAQKAMYGYLLGRAHDAEKLPAEVRTYEAWKRGETVAVPSVPYRMLDGLPLGQREWSAIARRARWHETRMNLNTYLRHGVFEDGQLTRIVAERLASEREVHKAKVFPYQLLVAWKSASGVPAPVQAALQEAMEHAVANVPLLDGRLVVCPDVSGSMSHSSITGQRRGATSVVRCIDVAALIAAAMLRKNREARVIAFETGVCDIRLNPRDSVMTLADQLAKIGGGGTNCSAPLALLNREQAKVDVVIYVSDNESWVDAAHNGRSTGMMAEWEKLRSRNRGAKLICIDLTPNTRKQAIDRPDILNVGGFSDLVFDVIAQFVAASGDAQHWAQLIDRTAL